MVGFPTSKILGDLTRNDPFILIPGKYGTEDKSKTGTTKTKDNPEEAKQRKTQQKSSLVQSLLTTLGQETRWAYSTTLLSPHGAPGNLVMKAVSKQVRKLMRCSFRS